ncbi:glycoside hydrolase family 3 protein [Pseudonocardia sp. TRM90224]|uniref:glycoside hydrolase family 3 protein n=1 Tax=Pseudonocardia sp. TRM90224 TaxID=2812678 RepID=UPI001E502449|nr:glycoside hydrolase family 3 protein [Pseudonocardia sp. TRM90224]
MRARSIVAIAMVLTGCSAPAPAQQAPRAEAPYLDPAVPVSQRVDDLLGRMTLDEKIGQMTQAENSKLAPGEVTSTAVGSLLAVGDSTPPTNAPEPWADQADRLQKEALATRLRIPLIYGVDAVHGNQIVVGSTIFPHNIGMGATRDPELARKVGEVTATETAGTGFSWTFAPCLCVARDDRWGRTYESFSESPEVVSSMTTIIDGLQKGPNKVLATAKHYLGDGGTTEGSDQGNTELSEAELRKIHLPPFQEAVRRDVGSVMLSYNQWNGEYLHNSPYLVNTVLKGELGFRGFVISDWNAIHRIDGNKDDLTAQDVREGINAGTDMAMVAADSKQFMSLLKAEVEGGRVSMERIDDANRRILTKKFELGLFEHPLVDRALTATLGSAPHRDLARQAVRESQVLLKNEGNVLPLAKDGNAVFVAGKNADDIGHQLGGWSITWQGESGPTTKGTSVLEGIKSVAGPTTKIQYSKDGSGIDSSYKVAVAVIGEKPYAEYEGDRDTLPLDADDLATLKKLEASGVPVVVVLVSGRTMDIAAQLPSWKAFVAAWLPGTEGAGVADVLFGDHKPSGKLPMTWMRSSAQQPVNEGDGKDPLFPLGFGLTY